MRSESLDESIDAARGEAAAPGGDLPLYKIALYHWTTDGSIGESIAHELRSSGHQVRSLLVHDPIPTDMEIVFTFAPYGRWLHVPRQLSQIPAGRRPFLIHWNTEGLPPSNMPQAFQKTVGLLRSRFDETVQALTANAGLPGARTLDGFFKHRMLRYRYIGDYLQAQRLGIPFLLADISDLYARRFAKMGIECVNVPFGSSSRWHADLDLPRDIDVLWIGSHGSWRRTRLLDRIREALDERGIRFHIIDGRAAPFVHGYERTALLNRTKIVLNLMRTPYDDNTLRHVIAMPNRALVVSEPMLRHNPYLLPGVHYVEAPVDALPDTIRYYLENDDRREELTGAAHRLTTGELTMAEMIRRILSAVNLRIRRNGAGRAI
ncbi:MAG TPA: glycosyltransferase [Anaerolineales bacterium]|nr:glycosyltransferase [Anaerolineales bacterium]